MTSDEWKTKSEALSGEYGKSIGDRTGDFALLIGPSRAASGRNRILTTDVPDFTDPHTATHPFDP